MAFGEDADVVVKAIDDKNWELIHPLRYRGKEDDFVVPTGMRTDFASVPRVFVWFLPAYGRYTKAAILHDYLWRERAAQDTLSWLDADAIFRRAMRELDVAFLRRWIMWTGVRWAALVKKGGWTDWWKESWRVLLISVLALPIRHSSSSSHRGRARSLLPIGTCGLGPHQARRRGEDDCREAAPSETGQPADLRVEIVVGPGTDPLGEALA